VRVIHVQARGVRVERATRRSSAAIVTSPGDNTSAALSGLTPSQVRIELLLQVLQKSPIRADGYRQQLRRAARLVRNRTNRGASLVIAKRRHSPWGSPSTQGSPLTRGANKPDCGQYHARHGIRPSSLA
jgi:hypothetical protein